MKAHRVIELEKGTEKLIVMPFRPGPGQEPDGTGLGLHFLAGNLICLHPSLLECWFGWRVKKIFPGKDPLLSYCSGEGPEADTQALGEQEKVRFWLGGGYAFTPGGGTLCLALHDTREKRVYNEQMAYSHDDRLDEFRSRFFDWLEQTGLGFGGKGSGSWPEQISREGLAALGRALEALYLSYVADAPGKDSPIDLSDFERAVSESPASYLAQDLLGWGRYKNEDLDGAQKAFGTALAINPDGMGAHAGQMWIALARKDRDAALYHAVEKGRCRGEDPEKARAFVAKKLG